MRKVDFLHYQGPAHAGYDMVIPFAFFWNALAHSDFGRRFYPKVSHLTEKQSIFEIGVRLGIVWFFDHLACRTLPLAIY